MTDQLTAQQMTHELWVLSSDAYVARVIGVNRTTVSDWRHGINQPRPYALAKLRRLHCDVFGTTAAVVLDGEAQPTVAEASA